VSFNSSAVNLSNDGGGKTNVYRRDREASTSELISGASGLGGAGADGRSTPAGRSWLMGARCAPLRRRQLSAHDEVVTEDVVLRTARPLRRPCTVVLPASVPGNDESTAPSRSFEGAWVALATARDQLQRRR